MANRDVGWNLGYFRLKHRLHNLRKSSSFLTAGGGGSVNITACFCFYDEFGSIFNFSSNELRSHTFRAYSIKIANLDRWVNVTYISYNRWCQLDYPRTILKVRAVGYWYTNAKESEPFTSILIPTCGSREHKKLILGMKCVHSVAARCYDRSMLDARCSMVDGVRRKVNSPSQRETTWRRKESAWMKRCCGSTRGTSRHKSPSNQPTSNEQRSGCSPSFGTSDRYRLASLVLRTIRVDRDLKIVRRVVVCATRELFDAHSLAVQYSRDNAVLELPAAEWSTGESRMRLWDANSISIEECEWPVAWISLPISYSWMKIIW